MNYIWAPILIFVSVLGAFAAKRNNDLGGNWVFLVFIAGILNLFTWTLLTKLTRNILFDALLYSIIINIVFTITFIFLGSATKFNNYQWFGTVLITIGFILMKGCIK